MYRIQTTNLARDVRQLLLCISGIGGNNFSNTNETYENPNLLTLEPIRCHGSRACHQNCGGR